MAPLLLISGGGTGGHVSPGLGVAALWQARHGQGSVKWVGRQGGIEERMAATAGLGFLKVPSAALQRALSFKNLALPWVLFKGWRRALQVLDQEKPAAVLLTGGYVGLPLGLAALTRQVPLVLMEPNAVPGLANRLLAPWAKALCLAYEMQGAGANTVVTGTPCRLKGLPSREEAIQRLGLDPARRTLLIMPGSQAARAINAALRGALEGWQARPWQWVWMCGPREGAACQEAAFKAPFPVKVESFIEDVATAYAAADLLLCRSGASTLAELGVAGKPSLQVPYPHATGDHQRANAQTFAALGAAEVLDESELNAQSLAQALERLLDDGEALEKMSHAAHKLGRPQAAETVLQVLTQAAGLT